MYKRQEQLGEGITFDEYREREFDKLEKVVRENIDIKKIYEILGD